MDWIKAIAALGGPRVRGVIHVGANDGVEHDCYLAHGILRQVWIEPQEEPYARLVRRLAKSPGIKTFMVACGARNGKAKMTLLRGNRGESNSLFRPKRHLDYHPEFPVDGEIEVSLIRLDALMIANGIKPEEYNLMVADVQGYELEVLKGAEGVLAAFDHLVLEVNAEELYESCPLVEDLDMWLRSRGFVRRRTEWRGPNQSYGDALYTAEKAFNAAQ
jgi:FkbM family methyltransferase